MGVPHSAIHALQKVQNGAARLILMAPRIDDDDDDDVAAQIRTNRFLSCIILH